ncbi:hypothetical protein M9H77_19052 [Catharanthus roseus]|uniref:Uncharacterized protein n=1 Tax=Catharanthus roseus TaxID=4058 RepID=A0ACC0B959_CATRO|nr:hypothetical protein M9H77_19052 [Catharanthus roseus]
MALPKLYLNPRVGARASLSKVREGSHRRLVPTLIQTLQFRQVEQQQPLTAVTTSTFSAALFFGRDQSKGGGSSGWNGGNIGSVGQIDTDNL